MRRALAIAVIAASGAVLAPPAGDASAHPPPPPDYRIAREPPSPPPKQKPKRPPRPKQPREPGSRELGFRFGVGVVPLQRELTTMIDLALSIERPLAGRSQWLVEYQHLWLMAPRSPTAQMHGEASFDGSGHALNLGVRAPLAQKRLGAIRLFIEGEAGGGALLAPRDSLVLQPHAFAGAHLGYQFRSERSTRASKTWSFDLAFRMLAVRDGLGFFGCVAMAWGD